MEDSKGNDQLLKLSETKIQLDVNRASIEDSKFKTMCMDRSRFEDVSAQDVKFFNVNLNNLEIENAQIGGAFIHNIGMPRQGHPYYDPDLKHKPVRFEKCDLNNSTITDCNLTSVAISNCNLTDVAIGNCNLTGLAISHCNLSGMTINGISVEEMLQKYSNN